MQMNMNKLFVSISLDKAVNVNQGYMLSKYELMGFLLQYESFKPNRLSYLQLYKIFCDKSVFADNALIIV